MGRRGAAEEAVVNGRSIALPPRVAAHFPAPGPVFEDGKDAFHRVPFIKGKVRDAMERVFTKFMGA